MMTGSRVNRPVVQRRRHLAYTQETMVRFHPGRLDLGVVVGAWIRQSEERLGKTRVFAGSNPALGT